MHTATYLKPSAITANIGGRTALLDEVFPDWRPHDRFGIVVGDPYGAIAASPLIQAAAFLFYEIEPLADCD